MEYLSLIQNPIQKELTDFTDVFRSSLDHSDGLLAMALKGIREGRGKRMRPMLMMLIAKNMGSVSRQTIYAAVSLELLHTASLVHDDVVDESDERRGKPSVNAAYGNKVAVLVGDYILSTALQLGANAGDDRVVKHLAELGKTLSDGEIIQLCNIREEGFSEESYYDVISKKTAVLFEKCAIMGAETNGGDANYIEKARQFGHDIGMIFQIRDDIFDYFDSDSIGKPTGNDMVEGKLTLPAIYVLKTYQDTNMLSIAVKVKSGKATPDEIAELIAYSKQKGGVEYAEKKMLEYYRSAHEFVDNNVTNSEISRALTAYLDFMIERKY